MIIVFSKSHYLFLYGQHPYVIVFVSNGLNLVYISASNTCQSMVYPIYLGIQVTLIVCIHCSWCLQ